MSRQFIRLAQASDHGIPGTASSLGWVAFHRKYNGAEKSGAIVKWGGRIYIDPPKFLEWMATGPRISPPVVRNRKKPKPSKAPQGATVSA